MTSVDAGSINSSVRIELSQLTGDVRKVEVLYDNMEKDIKAKLQKSEEHIKGVERVTKKGALTQEEAIKRIIKIRKEELEVIKQGVIDKGAATTKQVKDIKLLEKQIEDLEATQKDAIATTDNQTQSLKDMAVGVGLVTIAITAAKKSISVFSETEQELANVRAVTGSTAEEFEKLEQAALDAGESTRFTAKQSAEALFSLASAGLDAKQATEALGTTLELAGATGSDLAFSAKTLTSTMSQYKIAAEDASRITNVFAAANANSQANLEKITASLRQVGSVAGLMGISIEETVGQLQILYNAGFQGEAAGRALKSALADLGNSASIANEKLSGFGLSFEDVNPAVVGFTEAIARMEEKNITAAEALDIFGKVAGPQMATLIAAGKDEIEKYTNAVTDTNAAAEQYKTQNDTLAGSIDRLKSASEGAAIAFVSDFAPAIRTVLGIITRVINGIAKMPAAFRALITGATGATVAFLSLSKILTIIGFTLSTGPLAIVAGIGAVVGGLAIFIDRSSKIKQQRLQDEFGELATNLNKADKALEDFAKSAGKVEDNLSRLEKANKRMNSEITDETVLLQIENMAKNYDLTEQEVVAIALESKKISDELKTQIELQGKVIRRQEEIEALVNQISVEERARLETQRYIERKQKEEADRLEAIRLTEADRVARLEEIKKKVETLDQLGAKGAIKERDLIEQKKNLREEEVSLLREQALASGEASDQIIKDIASQTTAIERYEERLKVLDDEEKRISDDEKSRSKQKEKNTKRDSVERLKFLTEKTKEEERLAKESAIRTQNIITKKLNDEGKEVKEFLADLKSNWQSYFSTINKLAVDLFNSMVGVKVAQADAEIAEIERVLDAQLQAWDSELEALQERDEEALELLSESTTAKLDAIDTETQAILESLGLQDQTKLESLQKQLDDAIAIGDLEKQAELEKEIEKTKILEEAEQRRLEILQQAANEEKAIRQATEDSNFDFIDELISKAEAAGDEETRVRLQDERDRLDLINQINSDRIAEEKRVARETAEIKYQADLASWENSKTTAIFTGAQAAISAYNALAQIPVIGPALGIAAAVTAGAITLNNVQKIEAARPQPPQFATGGVVFHSPGGSLINAGEKPGGDVVLGMGAEGEPLVNQLAQKIGDIIGTVGGKVTVQIIEDGRKNAQVVADYINDGIVVIEKGYV